MKQYIVLFEIYGKKLSAKERNELIDQMLTDLGYIK